MTATRQDISQWFDKGVELKATHMIVVCDNFDYENYPVYVTPDENVVEIKDAYSGPNMQTVDEVYDLRLDKAEQMAERRAFHY